jgi:hypothetical protein
LRPRLQQFVPGCLALRCEVREGAPHVSLRAQAKQSIVPRRRCGLPSPKASADESSHPPSPEGGLRRTRALLAMTGKYESAISRRNAPELVRNLTLGINRGRRECRATDAPMAPCAIKSTGVGTTGTPDQPGIPCAMVLRLIRALLGDHRWVATVTGVMRGIIANLAPASERQDHTTSPSALAPPVLRRHCVHRSPLHVRDVRETPL